jgi:hypothetical protein
MTKQGNRVNASRVVWQDIRPVSKIQKPLPKKRTILDQTKSIFKFAAKHPVYKKTRLKLSRLTKKQKLLSLTVVGIVAILLGTTAWINTQTTNHKSKLSAQNRAPGLVQGSPNFAVLVPNGKSVNNIGGFIRSDKNQLFVYIDKINNVRINVSQQPLPDDFKSNPTNQVEQLAKNYKADGKITVGGNTIHIGTSAKGPQTVLFTKNDLLILIVSNDKIENDQWAQYISSLN